MTIEEDRVLKRILVLEDDLALNAGLCFALDGAGYCSVGAYNCGKDCGMNKRNR